MKLLFILRDYPPNITAESVRAKLLIEEMVKQGHEVSIIQNNCNHSKLIKIYKKFERTIGVDWDLIFLPFYINGCNKKAKEKYPDIIITWSTPTSNHIVGHFIRKKYSRPWVINMSDPWVSNPYKKYKLPFLKKIDEHIRNRCVKEADAIIVTTEPQRLQIIKDCKCVDETVYVVPNYFKKAERMMVEKREFFTITYAGSFYGIRTPENFLRALKDLVDCRPELRRKIKVKFIGEMGKYSCLISQYELGDVVLEVPPVPYEEVANYLANADVLLLTNSNVEPNIFMPLKLAEYMPIGVPILALVPKGVTKEIVNDTGTGACVHPDDIHGISQAILDLYHNKKNFKRNPREIERYNIKNCAKDFEDILKKVVR